MEILPEKAGIRRVAYQVLTVMLTGVTMIVTIRLLQFSEYILSRLTNSFSK